MIVIARLPCDAVAIGLLVLHQLTQVTTYLSRSFACSPPRFRRAPLLWGRVSANGVFSLSFLFAGASPQVEASPVVGPGARFFVRSD